MVGLGRAAPCSGWFISKCQCSTVSDAVVPHLDRPACCSLGPDWKHSARPGRGIVVPKDGGSLLPRPRAPAVARPALAGGWACGPSSLFLRYPIFCRIYAYIQLYIFSRIHLRTAWMSCIHTNYVMSMLKWPKTLTTPSACRLPARGLWPQAGPPEAPRSCSRRSITGAEQELVEKYPSFSPQWENSETYSTCLSSDHVTAFLPSPLPHCAPWIPK